MSDLENKLKLTDGQSEVGLNNLLIQLRKAKKERRYERLSVATELVKPFLACTAVIAGAVGLSYYIFNDKEIAHNIGLIVTIPTGMWMGFQYLDMFFELPKVKKDFLDMSYNINNIKNEIKEKYRLLKT